MLNPWIGPLVGLLIGLCLVVWWWRKTERHGTASDLLLELAAILFIPLFGVLGGLFQTIIELMAQGPG